MSHADDDAGHAADAGLLLAAREAMTRRGCGMSVLAAWALGGCYAALGPEGAPCAANGACPSGQSCEAGVCTSGEDGDDEAIDEPSSSPLAPFAPSNGASPSLLAGATGVLGGSGTVLVNSDTGEITRDGVIVRPTGSGLAAGIAFDAGPSIAVFAASALSIEAGSTLRAFGSRAVLVLVSGDATIEGTLDVSAGTCLDGAPDLRCAGPGGGDGGYHDLVARGCGAGGRGANDGDTGGGGGGFGQPGASGGIEVDDGATPFNGAVGGAAGVIDACARVSLEPLAGGSGGGAGGGDASDGFGGDGGGGGGAVQLTAFGKLRVTGTILASGGGGGGSAKTGGGGGGSGGAIVLEALAIDLTGAILAANGGGGGGGGEAVTDVGSAGLPSTSPASGGNSAHASGGDGGTRTAPPKSGSAGSNDTGGGGGAVGAIRLRARELTDAMAIESPEAWRAAM